MPFDLFRLSNDDYTNVDSFFMLKQFSFLLEFLVHNMKPIKVFLLRLLNMYSLKLDSKYLVDFIQIDTHDALLSHYAIENKMR